jgi:hypothetical protein
MRLEVQALERRPPHVAHSGLDFAFPVGIADATRQRDGVVVCQHVALTRIERRIVDVRPEHALLEIVEDDDRGRATESARRLLV